MLKLRVIASVGIIACFASLANAQDQTVTELVRQLNSNDQKARLSAIDALAERGESATAAVLALTKVLEDKDADFRGRAARALAAIGATAEPTIRALARRLKDEDPLVRAYAAYALGRAGKAALGAVQALGDAIVDPNVRVRREAVEAVQAQAQRNLELQRQAQTAELAAQEERSRIAREIHDGISQSIYSLSLSLETCADLAEREQGPAQGERETRRAK